MVENWRLFLTATTKLCDLERTESMQGIRTVHSCVCWMHGSEVAHGGAHGLWMVPLASTHDDVQLGLTPGYSLAEITSQKDLFIEK